MKYSITFRVWHWLNAFVLLGLVATVILRKTFLSWRDNSALIVEKLDAIGVAITHEQAVVIAKAIRAGMWEWHIILGYALTFLVLYRIYLYFFEKKEQENFESLSLHKKGVRISYYLLDAVLVFMVVSGLLVHFHAELGLSKEGAHTLKEIHEFFYNYIWIFIIVHIAGVVIADNRDEEGLVSSMINGKEKKL